MQATPKLGVSTAGRGANSEYGVYMEIDRRELSNYTMVSCFCPVVHSLQNIGSEPLPTGKVVSCAYQAPVSVSSPGGDPMFSTPIFCGGGGAAWRLPVACVLPSVGLVACLACCYTRADCTGTGWYYGRRGVELLLTVKPSMRNH